MNVLVQDLVFYGDTIAIYIANAAIVRFVNVGAQIESDADHVDASVEGCNRTACNVVLGSMNAALVVENSVRLTMPWCKRQHNTCVPVVGTVLALVRALRIRCARQQR